MPLNAEKNDSARMFWRVIASMPDQENAGEPFPSFDIASTCLDVRGTLSPAAPIQTRVRSTREANATHVSNRITMVPVVVRRRCVAHSLTYRRRLAEHRGLGNADARCAGRYYLCVDSVGEE